ncbi:RHS repeat protein, partial [Cronobacter malonaticus]|nr:RHS repeat protein [Cronobacter malonaticus]
MRFNRVTQLNGIQWRYDIHGRTVEKDNGQTRWRYRYDPLGRRISKTRRQFLAGQPTGKAVT